MTGYSIFDGHNDPLSCLFHKADPDAAGFLAGRNGDIDLSKCRAGGFACDFFAVWAGNDPATAPDPMAVFREFAAIDAARAKTEKSAQISTLLGLCQTHPDAIRLCTSASAIKAARNVDAIAAILHIEGCEAIGPDLEELHVFHAQGLRSLGPVWSRPNIFGAGVPFNFAASPDTGPGLTNAGARLVTACNALGVLVDLSHLNEAGFRDVARVSDQPLVATQSNAHAVTPCTGNLTDRQLDAMAERGGLAGLNFGCQFLRPDGVKNPETQPLDLLYYLDHLIGVCQTSCPPISCGVSDFRGAVVAFGIEPDGSCGLPVAGFA